MVLHTKPTMVRTAWKTIAGGGTKEAKRNFCEKMHPYSIFLHGEVSELRVTEVVSQAAAFHSKWGET